MNEKEFFTKLQNNPLPVVVDFWAPWCGPCRVIEPLMKKLGAEYAGRVDLWKVNADEQPEVLRSLRIYGIPTLVAFKQGQEVSRRTGAASQEALAALFEAALTGEKPAHAGQTPLDRLLRLIAGTALLILAGINRFDGWYLLLGGIGAAVAFAAVYDRCPIYRAVSTRVQAWLKQLRKSPQ